MPTQYKIDECFQNRGGFSNSVFGSNIIHICLLDLKSVFAEPINNSIMGAIGGPCSGHLSISQVALMEASAVGQLNSLPSISQTWAPSPGWNLCRTVMWE